MGDGDGGRSLAADGNLGVGGLAGRWIGGWATVKVSVYKGERGLCGV